MTKFGADQSVPNLATICAYKVSDEFDYGSNWTRTSGVVYPEFQKLSESDFVYTIASTKC